MNTVKRVLCLIIAAVMLFGLAACSGTEKSDKKSKDKSSGGKLEIGQVIKDSEGQFYIDYCSIEKSIKPTNIDGVYSYYEADDGKQYVNVCLYYQNLSTESVDVDDIFETEIVYKFDYKYDSFEVAEEDNRSDLNRYTDIDPLVGTYIRVIGQVPDEVAESFDPLSLTIKYGKDEYSFDIRANLNKTQTSVTPELSQPAGNPVSGGMQTTVSATTITDKQVITHGGKCEFYVDYCQITSEVKPPQASGVYSYYPADSGKVYVDLCISYKNLSTSAVSVKDITNASLLYEGAYKYTGFECAEEDNRGDFGSYVDFDPLTTEYMHLLVEVPEIVQTEGSVEMLFTIEGVQYRYQVK